MHIAGESDISDFYAFTFLDDKGDGFAAGFRFYTFLDNNLGK